MKLLLDTHVFLWWLDDPNLLADQARLAIGNPRNAVFVSAVCVIEIVIKQALGKLRAGDPPEDQLAACRFHELPVTAAHGAALRSLPLLHKDPFDRLLIAQAVCEGMTLVSRDPAFGGYAVPILAA